ncbi:TlpA family protein disulfide reductase [Nonlabens antarcticus]|uniref:TlpA family protein disulfide reductase n=1 Tax=Nonlabens antarcticus TaxID=392714 RepID=UPI001891E541|nr:TlpA disulfide reductase family protein [Nonlabens antarcticus]
MKRVAVLLSLLTLLVSCQEKKEIDIAFLTERFNEKMDSVEVIQYDVRNVIDFASGDKSDNQGFAVINRDQNDSLFGFSFYGIRKDINMSAIYKDGNAFHIKNNENSYEQEEGRIQFLGRPGGQMIFEDYFELSTVYEDVTVMETEDNYVINYDFEDDLEKQITEKSKIIELDKRTFLPQKITTTLKGEIGQKQIIVFEFSNYKTNDEVIKSVSDYLQELNEMVLVVDDPVLPNKLLNKPLPEISLKNLLDENDYVTLSADKVILIDFWEVWCGPCIASFPKVEMLKNKFESDVKIFGIVSDDIDGAVELVNNKEATFLNLIGDDKLKQDFSVNSWPRYFLVDRQGIILHEYHGFSDQIEKDIEELIKST